MRKVIKQILVRLRTKISDPTSYMALLRSAVWYGPSAINIALLRSEEMTFAGGSKSISHI